MASDYDQDSDQYPPEGTAIGVNVTGFSRQTVSLLEHGTLKVKLSIPVRPTVQTPHTQDELYIVVRGRGVLVHDGKRDPLEAGDLLFVAAGTEHQIEDFTDLALWVVFYGVEGGEVTE